jgi:hypothetical protein
VTASSGAPPTGSRHSLTDIWRTSSKARK